MTDTSTSSTSRREAIVEFLDTEAASGSALVLLALVALVWANSPARAGYESWWATGLGPHDLRHWVNDGLMALFFLVVGLEIKRELVVGELRDRRAAAVPALLFLALVGGGARRGWGVPMATDIAFSLGVLGLLGSRVPPGARVFLLALAIVDDLGAVAVIAVAYTSEVDLRWLAGGAVAVAAVALLRGRWWAVLSLGPAAWWCTSESGVHATVAGVALGLVIPVSRGERYEHRLHPFTSYLVVPVFALANAGVALTGTLGAPGAGRVAAAIFVALVLGKLVGVAGATWLCVRLRVGVLPPGLGAAHAAGIAATAGIGFTVSLFVVGLAYPAAPALAAGAKVGVLAASVAAAGLGAALLLRAGPADASARPAPSKG